MNRFLFNVKWLLCAIVLTTQWASLKANPAETPEVCPSITGPAVSCVNQLETYLTTPVAGYTYAWDVSAGGTLGAATGPSTLINWNVSGAQYVVLISTAPGGAVTNCTLNVTVYPRPMPAISTDFISDCPDRKLENGASNPQHKEECWVVCEYTTVNYWTTNVPGNTYQWVIVGGTPVTATGSSVAVTWGPAGTGTVILTETSPGGCSETVEQCVKIVESPKALFLFNGQDPAAGPLKICLGETVYFADQSVGAAYWLWDFGDGATSTLQNPSHTYNTPGTYSGTLTVKNECGCTNTMPFEIIVSDVVSPDIGCISTVCLKDCAFYSVSNLGNCPGATVTWTVYGGQIMNQPSTGSINVVWDDYDSFIKNNGYGLICVTVTGCPDLCDGTVCVRVPVIHEAQIFGDQVVCMGDPVTYSIPVQPGVNEPGNPPNGVDFHWTVGPGGTIISAPPYSNSITVVWNSPGTWTVDVDTYENYLTNSDCKFDPQPITVTVKPTFDIFPDNATVCVNSPQTFNLTGAGMFDWTISGPGGVSGPFTSGPSFTVTPTVPGVYAVSAVSNSGVYCDVEPTAILTALPLPPTPVGPLTGTVSVCAGTPYVYTFTTPPPPGTVYEWDIQNGTLYGAAGPTVTAIWSGVNPMKLRIRTKLTQDPFCPSPWLEFTITNYTPPANFVTGTGSACVNETHPFAVSGLSNYTNLQWTVSPAVAGSVTSGQGTPNANVLFNTSAPPVVDVICTAIVCGSPVSDTISVNVNQIPTFTINAPSTLCQYASTGLSVTPAAGITSYVWNFGDGTPTSGLANPIHSWSPTGTFLITAQLTLNICGNPTVTTSTTIDIDEVPVAIVTASNGFVICPPLVTSTNLTVTTQFACNYLWSTGATTSSITVTSPGSYSVTATDPVTGCSSVTTRQVYPCPPMGCNPATTPWTFTPTENCDTYTFTPNPGTSNFVSWDFGDLSGSTFAGTVNHTYAHAGYYQVVLTSYDPINGCTMYDVQTVSVKYKGNFTANFDCSSGTMQTTLIDLSEYLSGFLTAPTWFEGATNLGTGSTLTLALSPGVHLIHQQVTVGSQTCLSPVIAINVPGMPVAAFIHNAPKCEGVPVQFTNGSTGSYIGLGWAFGDGATSGVSSPGRTYSAVSSPYTAVLTITSAWGCSSTATSSITILPSGAAPTLTVAPSTTVCEGSPITITASPGYTYSWFNSVAPGISLSTGNPFGPVISGTYGLNATDANGCPYNVMAPPVVFLPPPYVQIVGKTDYCPGDLISISADNGLSGYTYSWTVVTPTGTFTTTGPDVPPFPGNNVGTYTFTVTITHTASGCTNSGTYSVVVHPTVTGLAITSSANCEPATLTASGLGAVSYNWNTGDNTPSILAVQPGFYSVVATNVWGCTAQATYDLEGRPDLSNVMTGCYEFCEKVEWQAINCGGCTYQWYLNGLPITGANGPTYLMTTSGTYTVVVSNGPGCETESDPIDISIASNPDLCYKCDVQAGEAFFECVGIDPGTGLPIYAFTIDIINNGGALSGLTATSSFGSVVIDSPVGGFIPGGGAVTQVTGHLIWDGSAQFGCFQFSGFIVKDCQVIEECRFEWCGELPKCCDKDCALKVKEAKAECIGYGFYTLTITFENQGCTLYDLFVKTDFGIFPVTPSTAPGGGAVTTVTVVVPLHPGSNGIAICGYRYDGKRCCDEFKVDAEDCETPHCEMEIKNNGVTCVGLSPDGNPVYHFNFDVYGAPAGSTFAVLPDQIGLVTGLMFNCNTTFCNVQGNFELLDHTGYVCFNILAYTSSTPPEVCWGRICVELVPCKEAKSSEGRNNKSAAKSDQSVRPAAFMLAPNPAYNTVTIFPENESLNAALINVTDALGQVKISLKPVTSGNNGLTLDIRSLAAGIYNVTVTDTAGNVMTKKLVVFRN